MFFTTYYIQKPDETIDRNIFAFKSYDEAVSKHTLKRFAQYKDEVKLISTNNNYKKHVYTNPDWQELQIWGICLGAERSIV